MLWLALHFPFLALDRLGSAAAAGPLALEEREGNARRIVSANAAAEAAGVCVGQTPAAALAACGELRVLVRDVAAERAALERLATLALVYSSQVGFSLDPGLLLEVEASQRLFGGLVPLSRALIDACTDLGYRSTAAIAPTPAAARLLARAGERRIVRRSATVERAIAALPLTLAEIPAPAKAGLAGIGAHRFEAVFALPRAELARRFGAEVTHYLDRLTGRRPEPVLPFRPPERFVAALELPYAVTAGEGLLFPMRRLARELAAWLLVRQQALLRGEFRLGHEHAAPTAIALGLVRPSGDAEHLLALARTQLERVQLPEPVSTLSLTAQECVALAGGHRDLFASAGEREDLARVLERLGSRLGADAVRSFALVAEYRPECAANAIAPALTDGVGAKRIAVAATATAPRPLFLLDPPEPLEAWLARVGDGVAVSAAERIESGWWDGAPVARDYCRLDTRRGVRLWVYRERAAAGGWFVHGIFA
jgi:protein ImuB